MSKFCFKYPAHLRKNRVAENGRVEYDEDGDLVLERAEEETIIIGSYDRRWQ